MFSASACHQKDGLSRGPRSDNLCSPGRAGIRKRHPVVVASPSAAGSDALLLNDNPGIIEAVAGPAATVDSSHGAGDTQSSLPRLVHVRIKWSAFFRVAPVAGFVE